MANIDNPNTPTNDAESPISEDNKGVPRKGGSDAGGDSDTPIKPSIEDIPESVRKTVDSLLAAARRDGKEDGKREAETKAKEARDAERQNNLKEQNQYKELYEDVKDKLTEAEKRAQTAEKNLSALEVSLELKLPNPHLAYKRLIGDTRDELVEDAKQLLKVLKSDAAESSDSKKKDEDAAPPATSQGGDKSDLGSETTGKGFDKYKAQKSSHVYNF